MIDVINLQRKVKLDAKHFRDFARSLSSTVDELGSKTFSVAFISDARMRQLNSTFRGKDSTTDVLSFRHEADEFVQSSPPYEGGVAAASADGVVLSSGENESENHPPAKAVPLLRMEGSFLGDIVVSAEQAERQAKENKLSLENEIQQLILHGVLHLCGYDHETDTGEMDARELELRESLKI